MKIAVLHSSYQNSGTPFAALDSVSDPSPYLAGHECLHFRIPKASAVRQVMQIASQDFDVAVNLCDGAWDEDRAGIEVVQTLERLNFPFTGAGSAFYDPTREAMKMACNSADVGFPAYAMFRDSGDIDRAVRKLRFPMLVKHPQGYGSAGILRSSLVSDRESLDRECARVSGEYGAALIEEFIAGREFTVMVAERRHEGEEAWALEPVEFLFPPDESFKHFDLKWKDYARMTTRPVDDPDLARRLREMSALTFAALNGSGYGRCDIRMDATGALYLLEINPNCGLFYPEGEFGSGDFILAGDPAGHAGFLRHLIDCAFRRRDRARRPWRIEYGKATGFGLFAARPIRAGEVLERYEEQPHTLVSRAHVERHWHGLKRAWFDRYAWPLAEDLHVVWSENPEGWRPLNHSCNPSAWLTGLDLVARRDLREGDEITTDYATYCGPSMKDFSCQCGAPECRGVIRGTDYLLPDIRARYAGHVSPYVAQRMAARAARRRCRPRACAGRHGYRRDCAARMAARRSDRRPQMGGGVRSSAASHAPEGSAAARRTCSARTSIRQPFLLAQYSVRSRSGRAARASRSGTRRPAHLFLSGKRMGNSRAVHLRVRIGRVSRRHKGRCPTAGRGSAALRAYRSSAFENASVPGWLSTAAASSF